MKENNYIYNEKGANLSVIKIDAVHCFCCGEQFQKNDISKQKTGHHAIPEELKPVRNVIIPVCNECTKKIHQDSQAMNPRKDKIIKRVKSMRKHYKSIDEGFQGILEDLGLKQKLLEKNED